MTTQKDPSSAASNNYASSKPKRLQKTLLIILGVFLVLGATGYFFYDVLSLEYYNFKTNHAKTGDKLYPAPWLVKTDKHFVLTLYRVIDAIDTPGKKKLIDGGWEINSDSLAKHNTNFIGTYKDYKIETNQFGSKMLYYAISTNQLGLKRNYYENELRLPKGYKLNTEEPFHVISFEISTDGPPNGMAK